MHPSITLADSEPEPDLAIVLGTVTDYMHRHPGASEVALVVEASDLAIDLARTLKKQIFAAAGIPTYWILHVVDEQLEVFEDPSGNAETADYRTSRILKRGEGVTIQVGDKIVGPIPVETLLP
jgi:Uma2 family endonuclease